MEGSIITAPTNSDWQLAYYPIRSLKVGRDVPRVPATIQQSKHRLARLAEMAQLGSECLEDDIENYRMIGMRWHMAWNFLRDPDVMVRDPRIPVAPENMRRNFSNARCRAFFHPLIRGKGTDYVTNFTNRMVECLHLMRVNSELGDEEKTMSQLSGCDFLATGALQQVNSIRYQLMCFLSEANKYMNSLRQYQRNILHVRHSWYEDSYESPSNRGVPEYKQYLEWIFLFPETRRRIQNDESLHDIGRHMLKAQIAIDAGVGLEDKGEPVDVDDDSGDVTMEEAGEAGETRQLDETEVTAEPGEAGESAEANETEQQEAENREEQRQENGVDGTQGDAADTLMEGTQDGGADTLMEDDLDGPVDQPPGYNSDSPPPRYEDVFETEDEEVQWAENGTPPHRSVEPSEDADDLGNGENSDNTSDAPGGPNPGHTASLLEGSWDEEMDGIPASPPPRRDLPHLFGLDSGAGRTPDNPIRIWWDHHHHNLYP